MATVTEAVLARYSVRAFLDRPVDRATIEEILETAKRSPSGGNIQPWHVDVVAGEALAQLKARTLESLAANPAGEGTEFPIFPSGLVEPWRSRRYEVGEQLYASIGIPRDDRPARLRQFARNFELFGAPAGLFFSIERGFGPPQWAHLGMFMQNIALLAVERGLGVCEQEAWALVHKTAAAFLALPASRMLYCGMAMGWPDDGHPINSWRTGREPIESFATFRGL